MEHRVIVSMWTEPELNASVEVLTVTYDVNFKITLSSVQVLLAQTSAAPMMSLSDREKQLDNTRLDGVLLFEILWQLDYNKIVKVSSLFALLPVLLISYVHCNTVAVFSYLYVASYMSTITCHTCFTDRFDIKINA
jgi:hypothetical protein